MTKEITPFSNGTEFMWWTDRNCDHCQRYENESTKIEDAGCPLIFSIELASVTDGKITLDIAQRIGLDSNNRLSTFCKEFEPKIN